MSNQLSALEKAREAWGTQMPEWVQALANACDQSSQSQVSKRLRYSTAVISTVLSNKYKGVLNGIKRSVEGELMASTVQCPILGEISTADCEHHARQPLIATNSMRVQLFKACPTCPNNRKCRG